MKGKIYLLWAGVLLALLLSGCFGTAEKPSITTPNSAETTPNSAETTPAGKISVSFEGILDVGPRYSTFAVKNDNTVWHAYWGEEGGGAVFLNDGASAEKAAEEFVFVFAMQPQKLLVGQWSGYAIDGNGVLWGWGAVVPGANRFGFPSRLTRILEDVADVSLRNDGALALQKDGSLYYWGGAGFLQGDTEIAPPVQWAEGVAQCGFSAFSQTPLALSKEGVLSGFDGEGNPFPIAENICAIENGFICDCAGSLYKWEDGGLVLLHEKAQHAACLNLDVLVLDTSGTLHIWQNGEMSALAEGVARIIESNTILFIDNENSLCTVLDGAAVVLDSDVLYAAAGTDGALLYIQSDGTLWMFASFLQEGWHRLPPKLVLSGMAEAYD